MKEHKYVDIEEVRNNPNEMWNLFHLSQNKQLTIKDIDTLILPNSRGKWMWNYISRYISIMEVRNNPNKPWDKCWLSFNKMLTIKDIDTLVLPNSKYDWEWTGISGYICIQEVINNPNKPWNSESLKHNIDITEKILEFFKAGLLKHLQKDIYTFKYHTDIVVKCKY